MHAAGPAAITDKCGWAFMQCEDSTRTAAKIRAEKEHAGAHTVMFFLHADCMQVVLLLWPAGASAYLLPITPANNKLRPTKIHMELHVP
jgi:hypothetical protein